MEKNAHPGARCQEQVRSSIRRPPRSSLPGAVGRRTESQFAEQRRQISGDLCIEGRRNRTRAILLAKTPNQAVVSLRSFYSRVYVRDYHLEYLN
jgi:hypothetical protein